MPFWWKRRRKPWFGRWRYNRRRYKTRRRRRRPTRRRNRKPPYRRRRRRHYKVKRKKKKIVLQQWQPDSIVKCKVKGLACIVAGAEGAQMYCYTDQKHLYPQPKAPGGGGFGCEVYSLQYLYEQWKAQQNIWTKSNDYKDLVRYTGCKLKIFRHPTTDFIVRYSRTAPFNIQKDTYTNIHPQKMLLSRHHRVILSRQNKPNAKPAITINIKPPKQMINKWFFQEEFTKYDLFQIDASAANLQYSYFGPNTQNSSLTMYALNTRFFANTDWQVNKGDHPYLPYDTYPTHDTLKYFYPTGPNTQGEFDLDIRNYHYYNSISWEKGFFCFKVLQATQIIWGEQKQAERPVTVIRYNPDKDTGDKNIVYVISVTSRSYYKVPSDKDLSIAGLPLWLAIYGFWNYILHVKGTADFFKYHMFVVKSPAIELITGTVQDTFPLIDLSFLKGKLPYDAILTDKDKFLWYPTAYSQVETLTAITKCGPYIPKYNNLPSSTWNLTMKYTFYFKWGGPYIEDNVVQNPEDQGKYPVPDHFTNTIQVSDPSKQKYEAMLRAWDFRRGIVKKSALKRMSEHLETDSSVFPDETETPKKKKKITAQIRNPEEENKEIQSCLHSLFEENTSQEIQEAESLQDLIKQQQHKQHKLKLNLIQLLTDLKNKQKLLQLHTGVL
nr:MAG: ORF1 [Torque teno midi virus]